MARQTGDIYCTRLTEFANGSLIRLKLDLVGYVSKNSAC